MFFFFYKNVYLLVYLLIFINFISIQFINFKFNIITFNLFFKKKISFSFNFWQPIFKKKSYFFLFFYNLYFVLIFILYKYLYNLTPLKKNFKRNFLFFFKSFEIKFYYLMVPLKINLIKFFKIFFLNVLLLRIFYIKIYIIKFFKSLAIHVLSKNLKKFQKKKNLKKKNSFFYNFIVLFKKFFFFNFLNFFFFQFFLKLKKKNFLNKTINLFLVNFFKKIIKKKFNLFFINFFFFFKKFIKFKKKYFKNNKKYFIYLQNNSIFKKFFYIYILSILYKDLYLLKQILEKIFKNVNVKNHKWLFFFFRYNLIYFFKCIYKFLNILGIFFQISGKFSTFGGGRKKKFFAKFLKNSRSTDFYKYKYVKFNFSTILGSFSFKYFYIFF